MNVRQDIQFLRGVAVLVVVLFHSQIQIFNQGYLGVDVFFVVSGFLITNIILKQLNNGQFSFFEFYVRRARRLLPALFSTLIFTTLLGGFFFTQSQWADYNAQLIGALTFSANLILPTQIGYFDAAAEAQPLLHIWSLSLEEQYYFLLPIILFVTPKRYRGVIILALLLLSLWLCFTWIYDSNQSVPFLWRFSDVAKSVWTFFLLPTRAWELLIGSMGAFLVLKFPSFTPSKWIKIVAFAFIVALCNIELDSTHPGIESIIVTFSTVIILVGKSDWLPNNTLSKFVSKLGDYSYSIYLVHWPLMVFAFLGFSGQIPFLGKIGLIIFSIVLGALQFLYVENKFRFGNYTSRFSLKEKLAFSASLFIVPFLLFSNKLNSSNPFDEIRAANYGLSAACNDPFQDDGSIHADCSTTALPDVAVWGDSYAMHLVPGIAEQSSSFVQLTKSVCGPFLNVAPVTPIYGETWAKGCVQFNQNVLDYLKKSASVRHVILSSSFEHYFNANNRLLTAGEVTNIPSPEEVIKHFRASLLALEKLGVGITIVSPPPKSGFNIGDCLERKYSKKLLFRSDCTFHQQVYTQYQSQIIELLREVEQHYRVVWLSDSMCDGALCHVEKEGTFMYRDKGHFTIEGSKLVLSQINLLSSQHE